MKKLLITPLLFLPACAPTVQSTPEPVVVIQEVLIPVTSLCVPEGLNPKPEYVDSDVALIAAPDGAVRYQLVIAGRNQRDARLNELEVVLEGCSKGN